MKLTYNFIITFHIFIPSFFSPSLFLSLSVLSFFQIKPRISNMLSKHSTIENQVLTLAYYFFKKEKLDYILHMFHKIWNPVWKISTFTQQTFIEYNQPSISSSTDSTKDQIYICIGGTGFWTQCFVLAGPCLQHQYIYIYIYIYTYIYIKYIYKVYIYIYTLKTVSVLACTGFFFFIPYTVQQLFI
jgi:hypothetical protein